MSDDRILHNELFEAFATASERVYIYVCNMKTDISRWSQNAVSYFGLEGEYMEEAGNKWMEKVHPEDRALYMEDIGRVFSGESEHHSCQYRALNRDGEYVWLECKGSVIKDESGENSIFAGIMTRMDNRNKYDALTGLLTFYEFYSSDSIEEKGALILVGIDEFRKLISSYGYSLGDAVLVEFARGLERLCGKRMCVYRFGGDEFLINALGMEKEEVRDFFEEIKTMAENLGPVGGQKISLSVSAGAVLYPEHGNSREHLINDLEHSLERAKSKYRGNIVLFSREIVEIHNRLRVLKEDLKNSIQNGFQGFELYFQPLVSTESDHIIGCESLLRWKGERIKDSYPVEFIKILEDNGSILQVGDWVMEEAIKQQTIWKEKYGELNVSFNVSYQQFMQEDFVDRLLEKAEKYGVNPTYMIIELTESCQVEQPEGLAAIFKRLKSEGFRIALDDFGTAYSSMELLKKLPADYIKIEHSFVRELAEQGHEIDFIIIENLLSLCGRLHCKSVVEGVENGAVEKIIKRMHPTYLQGYYYSKPVCRTKFEELLQADRK